MQTKKQSIIETGVQVGSGFIIALLLQTAIFPLFNIHIPHTDSINIAVIFTVASVIRSYILRRLFNHYRRNK